MKHFKKLIDKVIDRSIHFHNKKIYNNAMNIFKSTNIFLDINFPYRKHAMNEHSENFKKHCECEYCLLILKIKQNKNLYNIYENIIISNVYDNNEYFEEKKNIILYKKLIANELNKLNKRKKELLGYK